MNNADQAASVHIEGLLARLPTDPMVVTELYPALSKATYWVLIDPNADNPDTAAFLTYPVGGNLHELPIFSSDRLSTFNQLKTQTGAAVLRVSAVPLFRRLKDVAEAQKLEIALNPGHNGIRLSREILLSILEIANPGSHH